MADYTPVFSTGAVPFTATTSGAVTGGRVLAVSGDSTVAHAAADSDKAVGVAAHDAASGAKVTVWPLNAVHSLSGTGAITQGSAIVCAAAGEVKPHATSIAAAAAAGQLIGIAANTTAGAGLVRSIGRF